MTNLQNNPGTPLPPTPSNSSTPPPSSTSPKPRLRRVKMLARKTVVSGVLRKKLNQKLKASHAQNSDSSSDSESYQSATKREGLGSSDSEKTQESHSKVISYVCENLETRFVLVGSVKDVELPGSRRSGGKKNTKKEKEIKGACGEERGNGKRVMSAICGVAQERVEESGKKSGGSGFGEAAEGLVNLSTQRDEPGSSTEDTLTDLLKKEALDESKKKRLAKGKGKVTESSEEVDVEEMEQVHQEEVQPMEVQTPKPKKPKTSSKKSSSMSEASEPSLAKRTRSAVKGKQVKFLKMRNGVEKK
ncbi:uncharacterized protein [Nicotiana sylvestris]|uniref:uncharacterized protein n=1 Tax=Nicotiana sylvestris TaxID=4096 RepID=UPI00388C76EE